MAIVDIIRFTLSNKDYVTLMRMHERGMLSGHLIANVLVQRLCVEDGFKDFEEMTKRIELHITSTHLAMMYSQGTLIDFCHLMKNNITFDLSGTHDEIINAFSKCIARSDGHHVSIISKLAKEAMLHGYSILFKACLMHIDYSSLYSILINSQECLQRIENGLEKYLTEFSVFDIKERNDGICFSMICFMMTHNFKKSTIVNFVKHDGVFICPEKNIMRVYLHGKKIGYQFDKTDFAAVICKRTAKRIIKESLDNINILLEFVD